MSDPLTPPPVEPTPAQPVSQPPAAPAYQQQPVYQQPVYTTAPTDFPGKTLGIVGLVLVFFVALLGVILSHVAYSQSKAAGFANTPAKVGIILGWIFIGLGVIGTIIYVFVILAVLGAGAYSSYRG